MTSIRARQVSAQWAAERAAAREKQRAEDAAAAAAYAETYLDRPRAAAYLSATVRQLRRWAVEGRGPRFVKGGDTPQSRAVYLRRELDAYLADPTGYEAARRRDDPPAAESPA